MVTCSGYLKTRAISVILLTFIVYRSQHRDMLKFFKRLVEPFLFLTALMLSPSSSSA